MNDGRKSLRGFSTPFDLSKFPPEKWIISSDSLDWVHNKIAAGRYFNVAPGSVIKMLRNATPIELRALKVTQWKDPRRSK